MCGGLSRFEIISDANAVRITLNDNAGTAPQAEWIIGNTVKDAVWAITSYARQHRISASRVGYAVRPFKPAHEA